MRLYQCASRRIDPWPERKGGALPFMRAEPRTRTGCCPCGMLADRALFRLCVGRLCDRLCEVLGRLRALHGDATAENETRHAVDTCPLGGLGVLRDALDVILVRQTLARAFGIEAACSGGRKQH